MKLIVLEWIFRQRLQRFIYFFPVNSKRTLFSREELGICDIAKRREKSLAECGGYVHLHDYKQNIIDSFERLELHLQRDELKHFIYLTDLDESDVASLKQLLEIFDRAYNQEIHQVSRFVFSTEIMRTCHLLGKPHVALQVNDTTAYCGCEEISCQKIHGLATYFFCTFLVLWRCNA